MARKEIIVTVKDRERDLTFKIREMPATQLERWIIRALLLNSGSGAEASAAGNSGLSPLAEYGLAGGDYDKAAPLLDELLACCARVDAGVEQRLTPDVADGIIEDVQTLFRLRREALALNLSFFGFGGRSDSESGESPRSGS